MFYAKSILDQLMQTAGGAASSQLASGVRQSAGGGLLGTLGNALNNPAVAGAVGGGGGLLAGLLLGKKGGGVLGKLAAAGGVAALGGMAFKAYQSWQANRNASQSASANGSWAPAAKRSNVRDLDFGSLSEESQESRSRAMLTAIIAAANADGQFDAREQKLIREQVEQLGDEETVAWVQQELKRPADAARIAALATSPETASEIYLASLMVIDEQNASERAYLDSLADKLGIDTQLKNEIERQFAVAREG